MKQILIVEDDSFLNKMLAYNLAADGYGVASALNARTAAEALRTQEFDLVLLDINLPDGNGYELCRLIKPEYPDTIVIFLTANDQESDQIRGYEAGAVDYITKPFVIGALQRKIKAMFAMLEHHKPAKDIYDDGRLFLDFGQQDAALNGKPLSLSPMEYKILNLFRKNPKQVLTRQQLLENGTSGSGKSTLLHMMGGLDAPTSGNVIVRDKELAKMDDERLTIFRRRNIGFIFQNYNLVPILNVYENIVLPVELDGDTVDQKFMNEAVRLLGLEDKLKNMPGNLSGGQQQRVAITRALITKPAIVLADEPTGNLDSKASADVLGLLKRTGTIVKKLVKRSLASERRRNLMVMASVALAAFLVCFAAVISVSVAQIQRNQVADTYEAVFSGIDASQVSALKELPEFARVGEYYLPGQEHSERGYSASYVYCDSDMMYIARGQMELVKGGLPAQANEIAVSESFLSAYGSDAQIGETVRLDTQPQRYCI